MRATDTVCPPSSPRVAFPLGVSTICLVSLKCLATMHLESSFLIKKVREFSLTWMGTKSALHLGFAMFLLLLDMDDASKHRWGCQAYFPGQLQMRMSGIWV